MADPESISRVSPSDAENSSGGRDGEFGVSDPFSEATSPESLKNTPSNIAKLEDIIEQSEGRQKYLARTKSPSDGVDVRWYFCKVPLAENQLAASVPRTEIVGKGEYFRFSIRDSLALEASFLQCEEDLLAAWWKEYGECSEGPSGSYVSSNKVMDAQSQSSSDDKQPSIIVEDEQERVGVPVKGGLYEVDLVKRHCFPVYWHGENRRVLRGHWFARKGGPEWLPLRENVSEQLELAYRCQVWHRRSYQPSGLFAARVDLQGSMQGLHALFTGEDKTWEAWLASDTSSFSNVISLRGHSIKLRRGYSPSESSRPSQDELRQRKEEEMDDYCSQVPVGHLVFMVHGIGQRLEKANLVDDVATFRHITSHLAERHLTAYQRSTQRVLFIPCQWRRGLKLDGESAVEKITLDGVRGLRRTLSATVHDVLYYMSPIYCQAIINSVSNQLNKLHAKFIKRNPGYGGKISIYGHSLGSVLSYDILCHQETLSSPFPMEMVCGKYGFTGNPQLCTDPVSSDSNSAPCWNDASPTKIYQASEQVGNFLPESGCPESDLQAHSPDISNSSTDESHGCLEQAGDGGQLKDSSVSDVKGHEENHGLDNMYEHGQSSVLDAKGVEENHGSDNLYGQHDEGSVSHLKMRNDAHDGVEALIGDGLTDDHDKDKLIAMLTKEVILLKERIKDLTVQQNHITNPQMKADVTGDMADGAAWKMPSSAAGSSDQADTQKSYTPRIKYTKLDFKIDTFFAVGSPLGVFLSLRNIRIGIGEGKEYWQGEEIIEEMPACRRMFNIFHPFDPVAYRIEPLICKEYISQRPAIIPYHRGGKRLHIGFQEFTEDLAARSQAVLRQVNSMRIHMANIFQPKKKIEDASNDIKDEKRTYGAIMMQRLTGSEEGQIDYMLQDETFQHPFILAIGSHTSYWRDFDTALFILKHLYSDIPEEPIAADLSTMLPQLENVTKTYETDDMDREDLPLTFSDIDLRRAFSRRAKKFIATG